jgi:hypothetical protein
MPYTPEGEEVGLIIPVLVAGIREIHFPAPEYEGEPIGFCDSCRVMWPCPTEQVIETVLGGKP